MASVKTVYVGVEAVEGTAAATRYNLQVESCKIKNIKNREIPKETTGTRIRAFATLSGGRHSEITVRLRPRFDQLGFWLVGTMGTPTTTAVPSATGAFDHLFKLGGTTLPTLTIQKYYTAGWRQATGCRVDSMKWGINAKGAPVIDIKLFGRHATEISAPTPIAVVDPGWVQPLATAQQAITYNAISYTDGLKLDFEVKNNLEVRHTIQVGADAKKQSLGDAEATFDFEALMTAYSGSLLEQHDGDGILDAIIYTGEDTTSPIGTGTPTTPKITISAPKPLTDDGDIIVTDTDSDQMVSGLLGYNTSLASNISVTVRNLHAASIYAGT
jgi:hypothetical protein